MSQDDFIRTALRVPPDLHKAIHEAADKAARSFNAEIIGRLQRSFSGEASAEAEVANRRLELFMPFFAGLMESAVRLVEQLPPEKRVEPGPALMITLIAGMFDGATDGKKVIQIVDALGPVLGVARDGTASDEEAAAAIDSFRAALQGGHDVGSNIDRLEEAGKTTDEPAAKAPSTWKREPGRRRRPPP